MSDSITKSITFEGKIHENIERYPVSFKDIKVNPKVNIMLKSLTDLYRKTKIELNGYLTEDEIKVILKSVEDIDINTNVNMKSFLTDIITETMLLRRDEIDVEYNEEAFKEKLKALSEFQAYTIITMCYEYFSKPKDNRKISDVFLV